MSVEMLKVSFEAFSSAANYVQKMLRNAQTSPRQVVNELARVMMDLELIPETLSIKQQYIHAVLSDTL